MKGYNTSIAVTLTVGTAGVILVMLLSLAGPVDGRERPSGYEVYRNRQQRLQMEREAQMKRLEEKNSEFVKGKIPKGPNLPSKCLIVPSGTAKG
ncbi:hypothetical protein pipiens_015945 [Culex pipiens pipiens]|uniref:Uncharacterized protein n=1 Tax=Culex pipiens pipiens TaxID=38569 RepID=A0ABD1CNA8_CULPP